jgi:hypothetical protein
LKISNIQSLFITQVWIVLLYWNYSKMFVVWMFCFAEDNKIISGMDNTITEQDWRKTRRIFNILPVGLPRHYICLGCSANCLPRQQIFRNTSELF